MHPVQHMPSTCCREPYARCKPPYHTSVLAGTLAWYPPSALTFHPASWFFNRLISFSS